MPFPYNLKKKKSTFRSCTLVFVQHIDFRIMYALSFTLFVYASFLNLPHIAILVYSFLFRTASKDVIGTYFFQLDSMYTMTLGQCLVPHPFFKYQHGVHSGL